jgi:fructose-specific phosphotransferase system IIC component
MTKNQIGLVCGLFLAVVHAVWSLAVGIAPALVQKFINWILSIHQLTSPVMVLPSFSLTNAIILVIFAFIVGFVLGWVLTWLTDTVSKKSGSNL